MVNPRTVAFPREFETRGMMRGKRPRTFPEMPLPGS